MQCPYCKEEIQDGALKCKHCGSMLPSGGATTIAPAADFGEIFNTALALWKDNLKDLALLTLVLILVVWIPIANIGFIAGYVRSLIKVARGGKAQIGDLFSAWDCFVNLLLFFLVTLAAGVILSFVPVIGGIASVVLGFFLVPGMYVIVDRNMGAIDACKWSFDTIQRDFVNWLLAYLVGNVIACAGLIAIFIGVIFTMSLGSLIIVGQYERHKNA